LCLTKEKAKHMSRKVGGKEMDSGMPCWRLLKQKLKVG
jgi:hypothetical protein